MIAGMTRSEYSIYCQRWHKTFAILPVRLYDGRWAWLRRVEFTSYANDDVHPDDCTDRLWSWWVYRLPATNRREYFAR